MGVNLFSCSTESFYLDFMLILSCCKILTISELVVLAHDGGQDGPRKSESSIILRSDIKADKLTSHSTRGAYCSPNMSKNQ